jgi:cyclic pyranopterin phosphate synthase
MTGLADSFNRPINYLRISVTDRCNLRCVYCLPPEGVPLLPHDDILSYEEIATFVRAASALGISKVRLTGGEPLVRAELPRLVAMLSRIETIDDISLTTNGTLLAAHARDLKAAGLRRVNVSLDSLRPERFAAITRQGRLEQVLQGIEKARECGLEPVKVNVVVMDGINDDEVLDFARLSITDGWHVRFIELMPFGGDNPPLAHSTGRAPSPLRFVPAERIMRLLEGMGRLQPSLPPAGNGPARYYRFRGSKGTIGFITPVSEHFCFNCNRLRLTADGKLRPCLLSDLEVDVRQHLRQGASVEALGQVITEAIKDKPRQHQLAQGRTAKGRKMSQVGG